MKGLHIIADLYNCQKTDFLVSSDKLRDLCVKACTDSGLTVLGQHFYQFDGLDGTQDGGATGACVLAESHLAIHTWPERDGEIFEEAEAVDHAIRLSILVHHGRDTAGAAGQRPGCAKLSIGSDAVEALRDRLKAR